VLGLFFDLFLYTNLLSNIFTIFFCSRYNVLGHAMFVGAKGGGIDDDHKTPSYAAHTNSSNKNRGEDASDQKESK
jgi:hypothetical protein